MADEKPDAMPRNNAEWDALRDAGRSQAEGTAEREIQEAAENARRLEQKRGLDKKE